MNAVQTLARRCRPILLGLTLALALAAAPASALAALSPTPAWKLRVQPLPSNFVPGAVGAVDEGPQYLVSATNVGGARTSGAITLTATLPAGLTPVGPFPGCSIAGQTVTCVDSQTVNPGAATGTQVPVSVSPGLEDPSILTTEVAVSGGGALPEAASTETAISSAELPFGLLDGENGFSGALNEADGSPSTTAGSRPHRLTVNFGFQSKPGNHTSNQPQFVVSGGGARDVYAYLPHGLVVDPTATPVLCTEAQFEVGECPLASQVGVAVTVLGIGGSAAADETNLYNLVTPPGSAASFGFAPVGQGARIHVLGGVRAGDYRLFGGSEDIDSLFVHQFYGAQLQFWGDPSSPSHDYMRDFCLVQNQANPEPENNAACPTPEQKAPLLSAPTSCSPTLPLEAETDFWLQPGKWLTRETSLTDLEGSPFGTSGCNAVPFKPSLSVQPTTNLTDSPSGLNAELKIPQSQKLDTTATAHLKKVLVTLPEGLVVNPSSANGLEGCSSAQIGIDPRTGVANGAPNRCPNASRIGAVEVESPLLAQYNSEDKVQRDPEGNTIPEPISGSVFIATPHDNPFDALLAIYVAVEDPKSGVIVKLAGHVAADPQTGRLTTTFDNGPQLPFSAFKLHFFGGAGATLRTPLTCGTKTTASTLTPWSAPEGADVAFADSFQTSATPGGGPCPTSEAAAPNAPAFSAGTISPQAGAYSPFVLKLSREDGSRPISGLDATLPPGLTGKLAGLSYCPEGALAAAAAKSGNAEKGSPSCPSSSEVGSVTVGAGAGPTPYYTSGKAYLAGPYKGAPLSLAIVTPATAGPYDLGTVVVRAALHVDPETARIRAVSDPIPQILEGIPLDVRSVALKMDRPQFTLNPTSCDPMELTGSALSPFGSAAALTSPFQVGGCQALPFKPKLALRLKGGTKRGGHPALLAVLTAKPGEANIAKSVVALPHSEFLDQAHIKTICTRVQYAAEACPAGSIYGKATAITPLLDKPLTGPVYMRSSSNPLPDLVADLNGQIHVALVGRIDSVKGGIRTSFEGVPDAPVTKFVLSMAGGKKGLLVNSRDICKGTNKATVQMDGQNGKAYDTRPVLKAKCPKQKPGRQGKSR